jgi:hypothetical protein
MAGDAEQAVCPTDNWIFIYGGVVGADGGAPPLGALVEAVDGAGTVCGRSTIGENGRYGYMPVYRDDHATPEDEGADPGEWLTVRACGVPTSSRVQWTEFGDVTRLDLVAGPQEAQQTGAEESATALHGAYPNPFNLSTTIRYELAQAGEVRLQVFALTGQVVRLLVAGNQPAGAHRVSWDGRDASGNVVGNGIYVVELRSGDYHAVRRMALLK